MQLAVIIPCFNEERIIERNYDILSRELNKTGLTYEIIFCNDGSTDDTLEKLKKLQQAHSSIKIISYYPNKGPGYAYQRLYKSADADIILQMDADFSMEPKDTIPVFLQEIKDADVVVASRYKGIPATYPLRRRIPSRIYLTMNRLLFGLHVMDTQSGFIAFRNHALKGINIESNGFESLLELFIKLQMDKEIKVKEVPIKFTHETLTGETHVFFDGIQMFRNTLKIWHKYIIKKIKGEIWK